MFQTVCGILHENNDVRLNIRGEFDGLNVFEHVYGLVSERIPFERVVFDFSDASRVRVVELFYLLQELVGDPRFQDVELSIEGLQGKCMS